MGATIALVNHQFTAMQYGALVDPERSHIQVMYLANTLVTL
jgi:hypothetical protein